MGDCEQCQISNRDLRERDVPDRAASWEVVQAFALSFDGYARHGSSDRCASIANHWAGVYANAQEVPDTLDDLRTCLFFEQRRWRHYGESPDAAAMQYVAALLSKIRSAASAAPGTGKPERGASKSSCGARK